MREEVKKQAARNGATFFLWFVASPTTLIFSSIAIALLVVAVLDASFAYARAAIAPGIIAILCFLFARKLWRFLHPR